MNIEIQNKHPCNDVGEIVSLFFSRKRTNLGNFLQKIKIFYYKMSFLEKIDKKAYIMQRVRLLFLLLFLESTLMISPLKAMFSEKPSSDTLYFGCDCAAVVSCLTASCLYPLGLPCMVSPAARENLIIDCKNGVMGHCANWDKVLKNCTPDTQAAAAKGWKY